MAYETVITGDSSCPVTPTQTLPETSRYRNKRDQGAGLRPKKSKELRRGLGKRNPNPRRQDLSPARQQVNGVCYRVNTSVYSLLLLTPCHGHCDGTGDLKPTQQQCQVQQELGSNPQLSHPTTKPQVYTTSKHQMMVSSL